MLLHNAKLQVASHCCLYKFSPRHSPIKTSPMPHWSIWWTIKIFWAISNKLLSFWNLKIALVEFEILEKRYITLRWQKSLNEDIMDRAYWYGVCNVNEGQHDVRINFRARYSRTLNFTICWKEPPLEKASYAYEHCIQHEQLKANISICARDRGRVGSNWK